MFVSMLLIMDQRLIVITAPVTNVHEQGAPVDVTDKIPQGYQVSQVASCVYDRSAAVQALAITLLLEKI